MVLDKKQYEEVKPVKPKGLNFTLLVPQLTEEFKLKVVLGEKYLQDVFDITDPSEKYLIALIKADIKHRLPEKTKKEVLPIEQKEKYKLVDKIKQLFNK